MPFKDPEARRIYMLAYNEKNRDHLREVQRTWQQAHADEQRVYKQRHHAKKLESNLTEVRDEQRTAWLLRRYGMTTAAYEAMASAQGNCCAICGASGNPQGQGLHIDHDHLTGVVRGLLCGNCNRGIGLFGDDRDVLAKAIEYLERADDHCRQSSAG